MLNKIIHLAVSFLLLFFLVQSARSVEGIAEEKIDIEVLYLPSSEFMRLSSLGYRNLASDLLWFRAIQYYGGYRLKQNDIRLFSHLANVITDLDPQFVSAYKLSALVITEDLDNYPEGVKLMEKGIRNNPDDFWLLYEMGFLHYLEGRDYAAAERYFRLASKLPGADERAARFAADAAAKGGNIESSIILWSELAENSDNKYIRELAQHYIEKLREQQARTGDESI
ncbi:MAG: hypothetical protein JXB45_02915 [Candidatus Krumholzibacteriota bacterium]|nr:hypothetical protein [Candidatus Krumholzibacteriota bacterium]